MTSKGQIRYKHEFILILYININNYKINYGAKGQNRPMSVACSIWGNVIIKVYPMMNFAIFPQTISDQSKTFVSLKKA